MSRKRIHDNLAANTRLFGKYKRRIDRLVKDLMREGFDRWDTEKWLSSELSITFSLARLPERAASKEGGKGE